MKQDKVPTKLEMYQAFRDNLTIPVATELKTLPITIGVSDIAELPAVKLGEKFNCVLTHPDTSFVKVVVFQIEVPIEGKCEAIAAVFKLSDDSFEARVAIKSKLFVNDVIEVTVNNRWTRQYTYTDPFRLAQRVFVCVDIDELLNGKELGWLGEGGSKLLLLNQFVKQCIEESLSMYNNVMYSDMLLGEATSYLWHEYLSWVPPDAPAKSV